MAKVVSSNRCSLIRCANHLAGESRQSAAAWEIATGIIEPQAFRRDADKNVIGPGRICVLRFTGPEAIMA